MPQTAKILAIGTLSSSGIADLYTAPANTTTRISRLTIAMGSLTNAITLVVFDSSLNTSKNLWNAITRTANNSYNEFDLVLEPGDKIRGRSATASDVDYLIFGVENA